MKTIALPGPFLFTALSAAVLGGLAGCGGWSQSALPELHARTLLQATSTAHRPPWRAPNTPRFTRHSRRTPLPDWDSRTPYFGASRFTYDPKTDTYRCPAGQTLRRDHAKYTEGKIVYQAAPGSCEACALKPQCTTSTEGRRIHRSMDEDYLDRVRAYHQTEPYQKAMRKRKVWVEPIFAEAKLWHGMRRFRLRRLWRVSTEALMITSAQNLKRLLTWRGRGTRPASGMASPLPLLPEHPSAMGLIAIWLGGVRRRRRSCHLVRRPISAL